MTNTDTVFHSLTKFSLLFAVSEGTLVTAVDSLTDFVAGSLVMGTEECVEEEVATMQIYVMTLPCSYVLPLK